MMRWLLKLWHYLHRHKRIPTMPGGLISYMDVTRLDDDVRILIMARLAKDELQARKLMADYNAVTAWDVLSNLPPKQGKTLRARLMDWLRRSEGSYDHDPLGELMTDRPRKLRVKYRLRDQ